MKSVKKHVRYYWGIDAGTNSMGHAATDTDYNLLKNQRGTCLGRDRF